MCCFGEVLLNWHWIQDLVKALSLKFRVHISTKYRDGISLRILVLEWWSPKTVMCLDTMSASNKLFSKTNLCSLWFGEEWNKRRIRFLCLSDCINWNCARGQKFGCVRKICVWHSSWMNTIDSKRGFRTVFLHCLGRMRPGLLNEVGGKFDFLFAQGGRIIFYISFA